MIDLWEQILEELYEADVDIEETFNYGAGEHEIIEIESKLNVQFPEDFVELYSYNNGQDEMSDNILYDEELLSLSRIIAEWKIWKQLLDQGKFENNVSSPDYGIKNDWWNEKWIPFTFDGSGNHYCIDLSPGEDGSYGQVIRVLHDAPERKLIANSFKEFFEKYLKDLKSGKIYF